MHANLPPSKNTITSQLRRLVAYVAFAPVSHFPTHFTKNPKPAAKKMTLEQFRDERKKACVAGCTTGHWPSAVPVNNKFLYPRSLSSTQLSTPKSCIKTSFTPQELCLLNGTAPPASDASGETKSTASVLTLSHSATVQQKSRPNSEAKSESQSDVAGSGSGSGSGSMSMLLDD